MKEEKCDIKKYVLPSSWYFFLGYWILLGYVIYIGISLIPSPTELVLERLWIPLVIAEIGIIIFVMSLVLSRAPVLAQVIVFSKNDVRCIIPFRRTRVYPYELLRSVAISMPTYGWGGVVMPYLYLSSSTLRSKELSKVVPNRKDVLVLSLRVSQKRCQKLCLILPPHLSQPLSSQMNNLQKQAELHKRKRQSRKRKNK